MNFCRAEPQSLAASVAGNPAPAAVPRPSEVPMASPADPAAGMVAQPSAPLCAAAPLRRRSPMPPACWTHLHQLPCPTLQHPRLGGRTGLPLQASVCRAPLAPSHQCRGRGGLQCPLLRALPQSLRLPLQLTGKSLRLALFLPLITQRKMYSKLGILQSPLNSPNWVAKKKTKGLGFS